MLRITVFDSGIGGLSVLRHLLPHYPAQSLHYFADAANAPYGEKSLQWVIARLEDLIPRWQAAGTTHLVLACNTATVAAVAPLRQRFPDLPIVGVEPGVKPAALQTRCRRVGVLATRLTLSSSKFQTLLAQVEANHPTIYWELVAASGWVDAIENGSITTSTGAALIAHHCAPLIAAQVDVAVLGCTHYSFISREIQDCLGKEVALIDTAAAVAAQVKRRAPDTLSTPRPLALEGVALESSGSLPRLQQAAAYWLLRQAPDLTAS